MYLDDLIQSKWKFGVDNERLLNLVLEGKKKATCYPYNEQDKLAKAGELSIITDSDEKDVCLIQTKEIKILPFNEMTWELARLEGEHKNINEWQEDHNNFFKGVCKDFNEKTLIVFEKFEVIEKF